MRRLFGGIAVAALVAGVGGCALLPHPSHLVAIQPVAPLQPLNGSREDGYYASAKVAIARRDYARALELLQAARAVKPYDVRVLNAFGVVYDKLGRFDLSERYYLQAEALDPRSTILANNVAWSATLRQGAEGGRAEPAPIRLAEAATVDQAPSPANPAVLRRPPIIRLAARASSSPTRTALIVEDASGRTAGAAPVIHGLVRLDWAAPRRRAASRTLSSSFIAYPSHAEALARTLSRSLPAHVALVDCGETCRDVRLVVGADSARWAVAGPQSKGRG